MKKEWMNPESMDFENDYDKAHFFKHLKAYEYVYDYTENKKILELGCGAGYGIEYLSKNADSIVTVDRDLDSLNHAKESSSANNITYIHQNILEGLKFADQTFDIIISFQVIEHFTKKNVAFYLNEISRLLKKDGIAFLTTPNRTTRLLPFQKPVNKFHPIEYSLITLKQALSKFFPSVKILALRSIPEIEMAFNTRNKQKIHLVYFVKPLRRFIFNTAKKFKIKSIVEILTKRSAYKRPYLKFNVPTIDASSYWFQEKDFNEALDFIAICKKNKA